MQDKQYIKMTETPVSKLVLSLAFPTVVSMMVTAIYNMADTYFVSHISTDAAAAVGIVFSLQSVIQSLGFGFGMGAGSLISRCLGKKDNDSARRYASSAFCAAFLLGLVLLAAGLCNLEGFMKLFGANESTLSHCKNYAKYILIGAPFMCSSFVMNNILRAEGKAKLSMIGLTTGGILNIALDPLFISGFHMETAGAAIATLISQLISFCILIYINLSGLSEVKISISHVSKKLNDYSDIVITGAPTVCRQGLAAVASTLLNRAARPYGSTVIAAITIANKLYMFIRNAVIGIGQGFQPVAGYNYGAKKYKRVKESFYFATIVGTAVVVLATIVFLLCAPFIMSFFCKKGIDNDKFIKLGVKGLYFLCMSLPLMAYSTYVNQVLQCLGKVKRAAFLASCRNGIFYIPLIFALPILFKVNGLLLTQPLADILTCIVSVPFHLTFFQSLTSGDEEPEQIQVES